ncbi:MAG TPA: carbonic anhydrase [Pirellulales bacterium]|nr:carbonic anhydrase [Pirellulales bacterium]
MTCRRTIVFAIAAGVGLTGGVYLLALVAAEPTVGLGQDGKPEPSTVSADEALSRLKEGNRRCIGGESSHSHNLENWRERFLRMQRPFATILACSDSRVPPELLFDQGFGDLFVIRIAGNVVGPDVIASIQYAIAHLDNKLIVVTGHQNCGAVTAALGPSGATADEPAELRGLLDRIRPGIQSIRAASDANQAIAKAVEANVRASVKQLREVPTIAQAIRARDVKVMGVIYAIDTGKIAIVDD